MESPVTTTLYITDRCNMDCHGCTRSQIKEIPLEDIADTIKVISKKGKHPNLIIAGGEPLLYPNIDMVITYAKELGINTTIATNGTILRRIAPHRVLISYDSRHESGRIDGLLIDDVLDALIYYRKSVKSVGINHILSTESDLTSVAEMFHKYIDVIRIAGSAKLGIEDVTATIKNIESTYQITVES